MRQLHLGIGNAKHESCSQLLWAVGFDSWVTRLMFRGSVFCTNAGPLLLDEEGGGVGRRTGSLAWAQMDQRQARSPGVCRDLCWAFGSMLFSLGKKQSHA